MKGNSSHRLSRRDRDHQRSNNALRGSGNPTMAFISGMGLGAGIMYALDPDRGNRRRAMAQQKFFRLLRQTGDAVDKGIRDLEHRAEGVMAEAFSAIRHRRVTDDILEQRVRAKLGRVACHPGSIEVRAQQGSVLLSGPVLRGESAEIAHALRHVRGVRRVESQLVEHDSAEHIPGLQGRNLRPGDKPELLQENWAPGTRLLMGGLGISLLARSIRRPGLVNTIAGIVGLGLVTRAGRRSRIVGTLMDAIRPSPGLRAMRAAGGRVEQGVRTAGLKPVA